MRRKEFLITDPVELRGVLSRRPWGTLALVGLDGLPVALPMSHGLVGEVLVFHGSTMGRKAGLLAPRSDGSLPLASYSVVEEGPYIPTDWDKESSGHDPCSATQFFKSIEILGTMELIEDIQAKSQYLTGLVAHQEAIAQTGYVHGGDWPLGMLKATALWVLRPQSMTGKFKLGQNMDVQTMDRLNRFLHKT